jgi:radical SAM protein (TIGR01212 family)
MLPYKDFSTWLREHHIYNKVQKLSVDAGFTCPNRDGRLSAGGCTFCDNRTFSPRYTDRKRSVTEQLEDGKRFFARKYPEMQYFAYFQSFTGTYDTLDRLRSLYEEALAVPDVVGIIIGTRPDCVSDELLDYLADLSRRVFVMVEYGVESANDDTLRRINRGHTFECSCDAIVRTHQRGIYTGAHVILGLPGEDAAESLRQAPLISRLPIDVLKLHQLQVVRGTRLAREYAEHPFPLYTVDEYIDLVIRYISLLRPDIALDRFVSQCPPELLIAPRWGLKNHEFADLLRARLCR